ncbi:MAG: lactonase family protein [Chitinophagaceae bacterium]|nr:lactonase family protein [Chitinophagaceae bacterium]
MKNLFIFSILLITGFSLHAQKKRSMNTISYLIAGTYTNGKSQGIYVYRFNTATGDATLVSVDTTDNPSYLAIAPDEKYVYAVNENGDKDNPGSIAAFSFDKTTGTLSLLNKQLSGGDHPCYVAIDNSGQWVTSGNYNGGSVAVLPIQKDGSLGEAVTIVQHEGKGTDPQRQQKPHVHSTVFSPDHQQLLVPDLGTDKIVLYDFNGKNGSLIPSAQPFFKVQDGAGPRHLSFHPNGQFVYLMEEMAGNVVAFRYVNKKLEELQTISSHPADYTGKKGSADIHVSPDGKFLYASNRMEANSIAVFSINPADGKLTLKGFHSSLGKTPRNFNFDPTGKFLLVANQDTNEIVILKRDIQTGLLTDTGKRVQVEKPVCIKWISSE